MSISKTIRPKRSNNNAVSPTGYGLTVGRGTPSVSGGGGGDNPNEPAGYVEFTSQPFDSIPSLSWNIDHGAPTIETDATATVSPSNVIRCTYPAGYAAGTSPWTVERTMTATTAVYLNLTFRHSVNFQGESSGTNKMQFVWIHSNPAVFLSAEGSGSGNLRADVRLQNVPDARDHLVPNQGPTGYITRNAWHSWEVQLIANTPGVANGIVRCWLDGVFITEYTDVTFASAAQANTFHLLSMAPIWGGTSGTVTNTMYVDFDHIYVSKP